MLANHSERVWFRKYLYGVTGTPYAARSDGDSTAHGLQIGHLNILTAQYPGGEH